MKRYGVFLIGLVFVMIGTLPAFAGGNPNPGVLPPNSNAFGTTYGELAGDWWNWAGQFPIASNPILEGSDDPEDPDADVDCSRGQSGKVWFLAGNFGGTTYRNCTIPPEKAIFFPLINAVWWAPEDGLTEEEVRAAANSSIDPTSVLTARIDGVELEDLFDYRAESPPGGFTLLVPEGGLINESGFDPGDRTPSVADGFWILLAPLSRGEHTIEFGAKLGDPDDPDFALDVTYHITVER